MSTGSATSIEVRKLQKGALKKTGDVAEWLGKGLQNPVRRFESARHLIKLPVGRAASSGKLF